MDTNTLIYDYKAPPARTHTSSSRRLIQKLSDLVRGSQNVLLKATAVFPFDLIPNMITVDENKVSVIYKYFPNTETVHSVLIENITDVTVNCSPFFASLKIVDSTNYRHPQTIIIDKLYKKDAFHARKLIQGLITAKKEHINLCNFETKQLCEELEILGAARQPGLFNKTYQE